MLHIYVLVDVSYFTIIYIYDINYLTFKMTVKVKEEMFNHVYAKL